MWILLGFTALFQILPSLAIAHVASRLSLPRASLFGVAAFVYGVALFMGRMRSRINDVPRSPILVALVDEPYFIHWCASFFTTLVSLFVMVLSPIVDLARGAPVAFPLDGITAAYLAGLAISFYGVVIRRRAFVVRRVTVAIENLDDAFDGYRIAHLSDLHIGALTPKSLASRWVRAANALAPDLAVVTGDLVTSGTAFYGDIVETVASLRATDGAVVSMGNHDYFGADDGEPLVSLLREAGVRVLRNEGDLLKRGDKSVYLAAIDDTWTRKNDLPAALENRPDGTPTILLSHDPDEFRAAAKRGVDLVLSGHTHGGQVAVPFFGREWNLSRLSHHHHIGIYRRGKSTLYVHPGLGTTGPPIRIGVAPAVVEITLRKA